MDQSIRHPEIEGWGADLNPKHRPAVPKEKSPRGGTGAHWLVPPAQISPVRILHSIERPGVTPVFGTSVPPSGLSGVIRTFAFKFSEGRMNHWLLLLLADRVNMVEGLLQDLRQGHVPNVFAEMGWRAKWKHNRGGLLRLVGTSALLTVGTTVAVSSLVRRSRRRTHNRRQRRRALR